MEKVQHWLYTLGLPRWMPTSKTVREKKNYNTQWISEKAFERAKAELLQYPKDNNKIVMRDHCHFTGKFRGAAHQLCNLQYRKSYVIPCFFHNFSGYDSHHIFKALSSLEKEYSHRSPKVIGKSLEKFTSMKIGFVEMKDSCQLLNCGLDKLVNNLKEKGQKEKKTLAQTFPITYAYFKEKWGHLDEKVFEMLCRKGVYPYEYIDEWEKCEETELPDKKDYFNKLTNLDISEEEYKFAQELFKSFKLKTIGELHDLYMTTDVFLLSDVFESFKRHL